DDTGNDCNLARDEISTRRVREYRLLLLHHAATTEVYTVSLHDALPISHDHEVIGIVDDASLKAVLMTKCLPAQDEPPHVEIRQQDRKSTRLNSITATSRMPSSA